MKVVPPSVDEEVHVLVLDRGTQKRQPSLATPATTTLRLMSIAAITVQ